VPYRSLPSIPLLAALAVSCGGAAPPVDAPAETPKNPLDHGAAPVCASTTAQSRPLIVDWPSSERAEIEARARRGLVVVRADGCRLEVLRRCAPKKAAAYGYVAITPKTDRVALRDATELYANVPVYAAKLEGELKRSGKLEVAMTIVGQWDTADPTPRVDELDGDCTGATHVVTALTVGAFELSSSRAFEAGAKAEIAGFGGGGKTESGQELLNRDGDHASCEKATDRDDRPPSGCGAALRIEVVPLGAARADEPACSAGTAWDGAQCVAVKAGVTCPEGQVADKERGCVARKVDVVPPRSARRAPITSRGVTPVDADCADEAACAERCNGGDAKGCAGLGALLRGGLAAGKTSDDGARALAAFQKACDGGHTGSCVAGGEMRYQALGVDKDVDAAIALFDRACAAGEAAGCNDMGIVLADRKETAKAATYYEKACTKDVAIGCVGLGLLTRDGRGVPKDAARAKALFQKACKAGVSVGCKLEGTVK
jgi:hypothetical protein